MTETKCERCGKPTKILNPVLYNGRNGYRRYRVCDACRDTLWGNGGVAGKPVQDVMFPKSRTYPEQGKKK